MNAMQNEHLLSIAIKPKTPADRERLAQGLTKLSSEDDFSHVTTENTSGQVILRGKDELQLEVLVSRLKLEYVVNADIGAPSVAYHEIEGQLFEPIMKIEITTASEYAGSVKMDLTSRRGEILHHQPLGNTVLINAHVPLANMFGYLNSLNSMSSCSAKFSMEFDHYAAFPSNNDPDDRPPYANVLRA